MRTSPRTTVNPTWPLSGEIMKVTLAAGMVVLEKVTGGLVRGVMKTVVGMINKTD